MAKKKVASLHVRKNPPKQAPQETEPQPIILNGNWFPSGADFSAFEDRGVIVKIPHKPKHHAEYRDVRRAYLRELEDWCELLKETTFAVSESIFMQSVGSIQRDENTRFNSGIDHCRDADKALWEAATLLREAHIKFRQAINANYRWSKPFDDQDAARAKAVSDAA
jgi:hypothetical protein